MAWIGVDVNVDFGQVFKGFNALVEFFQTDFAEPYVKQCKDEIQSILYRFYEKRSEERAAPDGTAWKPLSIRRIRERLGLTRHDEIYGDEEIAYLNDTGAMFEAASSPEIQSESDSVTIKVNHVPYAELQQKGGTNEEGNRVPARPWMFDIRYDNEASSEIRAILRNAFVQAANDAIGMVLEGKRRSSIAQMIDIADRARVGGTSTRFKGNISGLKRAKKQIASYRKQLAKRRKRK